MSVDTILKAGLLGVALGTAAFSAAQAETLTIMSGSPSAALQVPVNRAIVVESDVPFAELSIANPGIADISTLSERTIYVLGKAPGRTTLTLLSPDGRLIANIEVHVTPDVEELKERLQQILPGERIEVRTANDGIVLSGVVSSIAKLDRALDLANRYAPDRVSNLLMVGGTQQVMLKVRFAEMQRSVSKMLSGSLAMSGTSGGTTISGGTGVYTEGSNLIDLFDGLSTTNVVRSSPSQGVFQFGFASGGLEFAVMLEALEAKGMVRTLAEPNLTALSGQEASFLAGGEYPIPVISDSGITIEYKPFGVALTFIPTVIDDDVINLVIHASVSGIDTTVTFQDGGFSVSAFKRRETKTTVEMRDGESFAIAGLLQDDFTDLNSQVPWLGDIPVLGALFRSADYRRNQSELVVIVTPHLVSPVRGEAFALPTDRIRPPTEAELFLLGKTARVGRATTGAAAEVARQDFTGPYGYVME